ncbi:MAG: hypothetical protein P8Z30_20410 [Acidobacteriota bacterium]
MKNEDQVNPQPKEKLTNRRELLQKVGLAIAASSTALYAQERRAMMPRNMAHLNLTTIRLSPRLRSATRSLSGEYKVFIAKPKGQEAASVFIANAGDSRTVSAVQKEVGASPVVATVHNGVIHVNLAGSAAAGSKSFSSSRAMINARMFAR